MKTVSEVSRMAHVSVRALHHYDSVGLLKPAAVSDAGYRLYDDAAIQRLQMILLLRELRFSLKEIRDLLDRPGFDRREALRQQIRLMELERERLEGIIAQSRRMLEQGGLDMDFSKLDRTNIERYYDEAKNRWGYTNEWQEFEERTRNLTHDEVLASADGLMDIFRRMGAIRGQSPESAEALALAAEHRRFINEHYYTCSREVQLSLAMAYDADGRMTASIDATGGPGTARFARRAIEAYCRKEA